MDLYISDKQMVVACNGASALFQPGIARPLRESLIGPALTRGARLEGAETVAGVVVKPKVEAEAPTVEAVRLAIQELMEEGAAGSFGATGIPKLAPVRAKAGKGVTEDLRDEAWALIQAETEE